MNKRTSKRNCFITLKRVLVAALILMVASGTLVAYAEVHRTAQLASSTMQSLKQQCISFNRLVAADRTKSLYRLSDMMLDLSEDLKRDPSLATDDYLEAYVDNLRLSGVLFGTVYTDEFTTSVRASAVALISNFSSILTPTQVPFATRSFARQ